MIKNTDTLTVVTNSDIQYTTIGTYHNDITDEKALEAIEHLLDVVEETKNDFSGKGAGYSYVTHDVRVYANH